MATDNSRFGVRPISSPIDNQGRAQTNNDPVVPNIDSIAYTNPNWYQVPINEILWNEAFPYGLIMVQKIGANWNIIPDAQFVLPIPPEALNRDINFAIKLSSTVGGIVEQHNAAPIRPINISGTTGLNPLRGNGVPTPARSFAQAIYGGSLLASTLSGTAGQSSSAPANLVAPGDVPFQSTGYYQFLMLQRFLEIYANIKKTTQGRNIALAFYILKEQAYYLVTPKRFSLSRSVTDPMMWHYSFQMESWGRFNPGAGGLPSLPNTSIFQDPGGLQQILNHIQAYQSEAYGYLATLQAFNNTVQSQVLEPLRQTIVFTKNLIGNVLTGADLPVNIQLELKGPILQAAGQANGYSNSVTAGLGNLSTTTNAELQAAYAQVVSFSTITNLASTQSSALTESIQVIQNSAVPANTILSNPLENFSFFAQIIPGQLTLPPQLQQAIAQEIQTVSQLTTTDFTNFRNQVQAYMDNYANAVGAGSADYNALYGFPPYTPPDRTPSDTDWNVLGMLNNIIISLNAYAATSIVNSVIPNPMTYVAALAGPFGIKFVIPNSKYSIPYPYGFTLEQVASRYLGDANRWIEIATLNNLCAPYVDEVGFTVPLLVPGSGYQIEVASNINLFVNQTVYISSNTQLRKQAFITAITPVGPNFVLTLNIDGLEVFLPADGAEIATYLPNTVNSQQLLYLPSQAASSESEVQNPSNEALADFQNQLAIGGADLLLTGNGDLAITPNGDCKLAIGIANLVQRIRLAIDTPIGTLLQHPNYGFPTIVGQSTADVNAQQILQAAQNLFKNDPSFTGVIAASVVQSGPNVNLQMTVGLAGTDQLLPVTFEVPSQGV